ncbi:hypothetical protein ACJ70E_10485 [Pseudomonas plecoglossicida]|uniref:hypothetical protein n=1 Tax=Pseudomonas plecoglossicida TaxID=70775 RepID=UPI003977B571
MLSEIAEAVIYAAATAAVAAAISLAVVGTVATGGAAGIAIAAVAGVAVGAMSTLSVGDDQTVGDAISSFCDSLGNSVDAPDRAAAEKTWSSAAKTNMDAGCPDHLRCHDRCE